MKQKRVILIIIAVTTLSALLVAGGLLLAFSLRPAIGYYRLPDNVITALTDEATRFSRNKFKFVTLNPDLPLAAQSKALKRVKLIFAYDGAAAQALATAARTASPILLNRMPSAFRRAGLMGETNYGMAVLADHFELAWNRPILAARGLPQPATLPQLVTEAETLRRPAFYPIVCAGSEDDTLLALVGALTESLSGADACQEIVTTASAGGTLEKILKATKLRLTLNTLVEWRTRGLLHPEWIRMRESDVISFLENDYAEFVFMRLSAHRRVPQKTIERFESSYLPSDLSGASRAFVAPIVTAIRLDKAKPDASIEAFCARLADDATQAALAAATGLAPVASAAETRDKQANDARLWLASSRYPLPDPGTAAFADPAQRAAFARALREYLESGGVGYGE